MPPIFRPWISPYGDAEFDWDRRKSLAAFGERDFVFEAARTDGGAEANRASWYWAICTAGWSRLTIRRTRASAA